MAKKKQKKAKPMSNSKLLFLSVVLLLIVVEALYIVKSQTPEAPQVAGVSTSR